MMQVRMRNGVFDCKQDQFHLNNSFRYQIDFLTDQGRSLVNEFIPSSLKWITRL